MTSAVESYLEARAEFQATHQQLMDIATSVANAAYAIQQAPGKFIFSNVPGGLPPEVVMGRDAKSFNGDAWPTAQELQQLLIKWHAAKSKMIGSWSEVAPQLRGGLQPPPAAK